MKRIATLSVFALALVAMTNQRAMAWKKFGFNVGMAINYECADNNYLWGFHRNGPVPGSHAHGMASTMTQLTTAFPGGGGGYDHGHGHGPSYGDHHSMAPSYGGYPYAGTYDYSSQTYASGYNGVYVMPYASGTAATPTTNSTLPAPVQSTVTPSYPGMPTSYWPRN